MSKLRLRGSTSGYTEIQASAVAGDNTITLPATTGGSLLAADSSGNVNIDSGTLYVDATNNRVGIGTTSPSRSLTLRENAANPRVFQLSRVNSDNGCLYLGHDSSDNVLITANNSALIFGKEAGGSISEYARIDTSGRLLVGTSSAGGTELIQVQGTSGGSSLPGGIALRRASFGNGDDIGYVNFTNASGNIHAGIKALCDGAPGTNDYPGALSFSVTQDGSASPTERQRISNNGETVFYGNGSVIAGRSNTGAGTGVEIFNGYHSATGVTNGTRVIAIYTNGNIQNTNNSYGALSDLKLKENIVDASSQWDDLKALQVRKYNLKEGQTHTQIGLIAQEAELVSPGLVFETPDRDEAGNETGEVTKGVNYSVLYMKAVKALQEAMERIETLEAKVAALEAS